MSTISIVLPEKGEMSDGLGGIGISLFFCLSSAQH
jgi:hypothetical protein